MCANRWVYLSVVSRAVLGNKKTKLWVIETESSLVIVLDDSSLPGYQPFYEPFFSETFSIIIVVYLVDTVNTLSLLFHHVQLLILEALGTVGSWSLNCGWHGLTWRGPFAGLGGPVVTLLRQTCPCLFPKTFGAGWSVHILRLPWSTTPETKNRRRQHIIRFRSLGSWVLGCGLCLCSLNWLWVNINNK